MQLFDPSDPRPVHFMGIAGAGMSALALVARRRGVPVTGCDLDIRDADDIIDAGAAVHVGHDPSHVTGVRAVVHTAAVPADHPELQAAVEQGVPAIKRAAALGELIAGTTVVGISGTHGKTTTTTMATEVLLAAGAHPSGIVGGRVQAWGGNARLDGEELFVVEADEYDKSFLSIHPTVAVINNLEADHPECYGDYEALEAAFVEFGNRAEHVLIGSDDPGAMALRDRLDVPVTTVGRSGHADVRITSLDQHADRTVAEVSFPDGKRLSFELGAPGVHNARNATLALAVCHTLGHDVDRGAQALVGFTGVGRRFELLVSGDRVTVVDDYAHHPSEVRATIEAARQRFPGSRILAVFQPHLYSRTSLHGAALGEALAGADRVFVTDIYPAREPAMEGVTGQLVVDAARGAGANVTWVPLEKDVAAAVSETVRPGDAVIVLGAGTITRVAHELAATLGTAVT